MVERTDDHAPTPGTSSAMYCSAVSARHASRTLAFAQRSYANNATTSSCMWASSRLGQPRPCLLAEVEEWPPSPGRAGRLRSQCALELLAVDLDHGHHRLHRLAGPGRVGIGDH